MDSRISNHTTAQARPAVVNVNTASLTELRALPRVSEAVAQAIIDGRPYSSTDDLIRVYGIGPKTLEGIRPYIKVNDAHPHP
ncbi:MAG: ComEA family DNA-binding protein [Sideroxydans sp.]